MELRMVFEMVIVFFVVWLFTHTYTWFCRKSHTNPFIPIAHSYGICDPMVWRISHELPTSLRINMNEEYYFLAWSQAILNTYPPDNWPNKDDPFTHSERGPFEMIHVRSGCRVCLKDSTVNQISSLYGEWIDKDSLLERDDYASLLPQRQRCSVFLCRQS